MENGSTYSPGVSIIVCCHNSGRRLPETLQHLARQSMPSTIGWEVVVVNNASTDDTPTVAVDRWAALGRPAPLTVVSEPTPGLSHARARGIASARYGTIIFVDDDNWLDSNYCRLAAQLMQQHPEIGALGGYIASHPEVAPPVWFHEFQGAYAVGPQAAASGDITDVKPHVAGAGLVLRRSAYERLLAGGFGFLLTDRCGTQVVSGGDTELCYALALAGYRIWYDETLRIVHFIPKERLTKAYVANLISGNESSAPVGMLYEMALRRPSASPSQVYFRNVLVHLFWMVKGSVKTLIGRQSTSVLLAECEALWFSLKSLPTLMRLFAEHYPGMLRLRGIRSSEIAP